MGAPRPTTPVTYEPKKTLASFGKIFVFAGVGAVLSDTTGLTALVLHYLPAQFQLLGPVIAAAVIGALTNWFKNIQRGNP